MNIRIRDATEEDAERIAEIASEDVLHGHESLSVDSVKDMVHDRTLRVAETDEVDGDGVIGYVSYEVRPDTESVVVHHLGLGVGDADADEALLGRLLDEPISVAENEEVSVRVAVEKSDSSLSEALEGRGFEVTETRRFRREKLLVYELAVSS